MDEHHEITFTARGSASATNEDNGWYARITTQYNDDPPRYQMTVQRFDTEAEAQAFADGWAQAEVAAFKRAVNDALSQLRR